MPLPPPLSLSLMVLLIVFLLLHFHLFFFFISNFYVNFFLEKSQFEVPDETTIDTIHDPNKSAIINLLTNNMYDVLSKEIKLSLAQCEKYSQNYRAIQDEQSNKVCYFMNSLLLCAIKMSKCPSPLFLFFLFLSSSCGSKSLNTSPLVRIHCNVFNYCVIFIVLWRIYGSPFHSNFERNLLYLAFPV